MALQFSPEQVAQGVPVTALGESPASQLKSEFQSLQGQFRMQPPAIQCFIKNQASQLAGAFVGRQGRIRFELPDKIVVISAASGEISSVSIPVANRQYSLGGLIGRLVHNDIRVLLDRCLADLELSREIGLAVSARLIRFATANYVIDQMLPTGRDVTYTAPDLGDIPCFPLDHPDRVSSAITSENDAVISEEIETGNRGELQAPYTPWARRFYLPQWVPFDQDGQLVVSSIKEAQGYLATMQNYLEILQAAVTLAPYMAANPLFQHKRSGMLGQLVNQGRIYAFYITSQVISKIKQYALRQDLNRGLSLSLPFFNEQALKIQNYTFEIIPVGRIMFVPAFVVLAARHEQIKVAQDTSLSPSTRKHLLAELEQLEKAFS